MTPANEAQIRRLAELRTIGQWKPFVEAWVIAHGEWLEAEEHWMEYVGMFQGAPEFAAFNGPSLTRRAEAAAQRYLRLALDLQSGCRFCRASGKLESGRKRWFSR